MNAKTIVSSFGWVCYILFHLSSTSLFVFFNVAYQPWMYCNTNVQGVIKYMLTFFCYMFSNSVKLVKPVPYSLKFVKCGYEINCMCIFEAVRKVHIFYYLMQWQSEKPRQQERCMFDETRKWFSPFLPFIHPHALVVSLNASLMILRYTSSF